MMELAIEEALKSGSDIPVGAVIVKDGKIISSSCNKREKYSDITAHAEILAIKEAEKVIDNWRLDGCEMYVTLEPCPMCAWAIIQSRIPCVEGKIIIFGISFILQVIRVIICKSIYIKCVMIKMPHEEEHSKTA